MLGPTGGRKVREIRRKGSSALPYFLAANDRRLFYIERGVGEPTLLFIHGLGGTSLHWEKQLDFFGRNGRCIAIDLPGCGKSDGPASGYSIELLARSVHSLVVGLDLKKPILVGHSLGGWVSLEYNLKFPAEARALVIVDSFVGFANSSFSRALSERLRSARAHHDDFEGFLKGFASSLLHRERTDGVGDGDYEERFAAEFVKTPYETYCGMLDALIGKTMEMLPERRLVLAWSEEAVPVLLIKRYVDEDRELVNSLFSSQVPDIRVVDVKGTGHYIMIDAADSFNSELGAFLERVSHR
jgi:pimeloyl-ACP methyl ester carboxylesterase